jgi:tripeptidyl-peptidase-1
VNYRVIDRGADKGYLGTSCAAPTFNAIIALLNSARIDSGLPTLGFLNPWLYGVGRGGLNDITKGWSGGCDGYSNLHRIENGSPVLPGAGWNASIGWDAVTGLGTPDFGKLLRLSTPWIRNDGGWV